MWLTGYSDLSSFGDYFGLIEHDHKLLVGVVLFVVNQLHFDCLVEFVFSKLQRPIGGSVLLASLGAAIDGVVL